MTLATAVILSHNRQDMLRRQLLYYANKPVHLILADGSDDDWETGQSGSIGDMTWEYFRISGFYSYLVRMAEALRRVRTDYMFFLDDEECILMTGVKTAVNFLDLNPEHSCAGGHVATSSSSVKRLSVVPHYGPKNNFKLVDKDPYRRFKSLFNSKSSKSLVYTLRRTRDAMAFAEVFDRFEFEGKLHVLFENLHNGFTALAGMYEGGSYPFLIRAGGSVPPDDKEIYSIGLEEDQRACHVLANAIFLSGRGLNAPPEVGMTAGEFLASFLPKVTVDRGKISIPQVGTKARLALYLFDYFPQIYWALNKNGLMTFSHYADKYASGSSEVKRDLSDIENLWKRFPKGLSKFELEFELSKTREWSARFL